MGLKDSELRQTHRKWCDMVEVEMEVCEPGTHLNTVRGALVDMGNGNLLSVEMVFSVPSNPSACDGD
jgi:hypothetical protein